MKYQVKHITRYQYGDKVPVCLNEVHLTPRQNERQTCLKHRLQVRPRPMAVTSRVDYFGNPVHFFTVQTGHSHLTVMSRSLVEIRPSTPPRPASTPAWETVRDGLPQDTSSTGLEAFQFVFDSPCIRSSPELGAYCALSFRPGRPILEAALDLTHRIYHEFKYQPGSTSVNTPPSEVLRTRRGVCQDFAHVQIGCLRSLGLAARYVSGYLLTQPPPGQPRLLGADASHAWLSIYIPQHGWVDLDPTNNIIPALDHILLAWGRDYSDVCPVKGIFHGGGRHSVSVSVDVNPLSTSDPPASPSVPPIAS